MILEHLTMMEYTTVQLPAAGFMLLRKLDKATRSTSNAQHSVLHSILRDTRKTVFGKQHGISGTESIDEYRRRVPIFSYNECRSYIDRMVQGEPDVLFTGKPLFYHRTGTRKIPRLLPVSQRYFNAAVQRFNTLWLYSSVHDNPALFRRPWFSAFSPAVEGHVEDGTPFGAMSGAIFRALPKILQKKHAVPECITTINNSEARLYATMRFALHQNPGWIVVANPQLLSHYHRTILASSENLIRDIHDGTLKTDIVSELDPELRFPLLKSMTPDPERAKLLSALSLSHGNNLQPKHYWPELQCVSTWKEGNCTDTLREISHTFPRKTIFRELGYQASEVRGGMVLGNDWSFSLPMINEYSFEFIETGTIVKPDTPTLLTGELEVGKSYYLLVTNGSGLFRYHINDIVRVTGYYNTCPLLEYIQRGESFTSIHSEALSEKQVLQAIHQAGVETDVHPVFFTLFCVPPEKRYRLYIEFPDQPDTTQKNHFMRSFDAHLKYYNTSYANARDTDVILQPALVELHSNAGDHLSNLFVDDGEMPKGTFILKHLQCDPETMHVFDEFKKDVNFIPDNLPV